MGILKYFEKGFFGQGGEQSTEKSKKTEEALPKKKRRRSKKRVENFRVQKEEQTRKKRKKKSVRESRFPESIPVPQKRSWQEVVEQQKLVIFPITRNELNTNLSSVKALQEAILERRPDIPFRSSIRSGEDYKKILQTWLRGADDSKIALFDTFLHRSNAQASRTEVGEDLLRVLQDSFVLVHAEKQKRQSFLFRNIVLQQVHELIHGKGDGKIESASKPLLGPDEFYKKLHVSFLELSDKNLEKFETFLKKAHEVSDAPEKKKDIDAVVQGVLAMSENEKKSRASYVYRGKILAGIGAAPKGGIASRDEFKNKLSTWLKTADHARIAPLEHTIRLARERTRQEKVSEDVRQVIQDVEILLSEALSKKKAEEILKKITSEKKEEKIATVVAPLEEIQKVYESRAVGPNELRAQILQRIGSPDTEVSVGQGYFENRLREWIQLATTTEKQKEDALKDVQNKLREIESNSDIKKRKEKIKIFQRAEEILTNRQAI